MATQNLTSNYRRFSPNGPVNSGIVTSSTQLILKEAMALGMLISRIPFTPIYKLEYKGEIRDFYFQNPGISSATAMLITKNKRLAKNVLSDIGISVPKGYSIRKNDSKESFESVYHNLQKPLVVKPCGGTQGKAITIGVDSIREYMDAIQTAFDYSTKKNPEAIVEEMLSNYTEYRVLATRGKVIGIIKRVPANVVGDGVSSILALVARKNLDPRRGDFENHPPLFKILIDERLKNFLKKQKLTIESVPQLGQQIFLRGVSNISMGGDSYDYTDKAHPSVSEICLKAVNAIPGLELGGVDFMTKDISKMQSPNSYSIIEVNDSPGLDIHDYPYEGKNRKAGVEFLRVLFGKL